MFSRFAAMWILCTPRAVASRVSSMKVKRFAYYLSKFSLIDELLGFLYWCIVVIGIVFAFRWVESKFLLALILSVYVVSAVLIYLYLLKALDRYFKK